MKKLPIKPRVSHIVLPVPNGDLFNFVYTGLNEPQLFEVRVTDFHSERIETQMAGKNLNQGGDGGG